MSQSGAIHEDIAGFNAIRGIGSTSITFEIPEDSDVQLSIYNLAGRKVHTLVHEMKDAGKHTIQLNGNNLSSGIYFYVRKPPHKDIVRKLALIK